MEGKSRAFNLEFSYKQKVVSHFIKTLTITNEIDEFIYHITIMTIFMMISLRTVKKSNMICAREPMLLIRIPKAVQKVMIPATHKSQKKFL